jgi:hypothetical protein
MSASMVKGGRVCATLKPFLPAVVIFCSLTSMSFILNALVLSPFAQCWRSGNPDRTGPPRERRSEKSDRTWTSQQTEVRKTGPGLDLPASGGPENRTGPGPRFVPAKPDRTRTGPRRGPVLTEPPVGPGNKRHGATTTRVSQFTFR